MKISKSVVAVAVSSVLLFGCDFDVGPNNTATAGSTTAGSTTAGSTTGGDTANTSGSLNHVVKITDTKTDDKGELRVKLSEATKHDATPVTSIADGKFTVDLTQIANQGTSDGNGVNVALFANEKANNSDLFGEIVFAGGKAGDPAAVQYRSLVDMKLHPLDNYIVGDELSVTVEWTNGTYSFKVDDKTNPDKSVSYDASQLPDSVITDAPVVVIAVKLGDKSKTTTDELHVDNFNIYQGLGDDAKLVFGDDFELRGEGSLLNVLPYNTNSNEAVVISEGGTASSVTTPSQGSAIVTSGKLADDFESYNSGDKPGGDWILNNMKEGASAAVTNVKANGGVNSLLLQDHSVTTKPYTALPFKSDATSGSVSIDAFFPSTNVKSTYINVGTGKSNAQRFIELKQSSTKLEYEAGDKDVKIADITPDKWYTINLSWAADGSFSVMLDGKALADATNVPHAKTGLDAAMVPTQLTLYTGDDKGDSNEAYFDNVKSDLF